MCLAAAAVARMHPPRGQSRTGACLPGGAPPTAAPARVCRPWGLYAAGAAILQAARSIRLRPCQLSQPSPLIHLLLINRAPPAGSIAHAFRCSSALLCFVLGGPVTTGSQTGSHERPIETPLAVKNHIPRRGVDQLVDRLTQPTMSRIVMQLRMPHGLQ